MTLEIGAADDPLEREADRVAERVMRMEVPGETPLETGHLGRPAVSRSSEGAVVAGQAPASVHATLASTGQPLTSSELAFFEPRFGADFSQVRLHTDGLAQQSAHDVHAQAYTVGSHVVFGMGRYAPSSPVGQRLLAHELAHVIQQTDARRGTKQLIQRTVDEVLINCADDQITFSHDGTQSAYALDHCDVEEGTYTADVRLGTNRVDFDLDADASTRFNFQYSIRPGQANPSTFFRGQSRVRIVAAHASGNGGNGEGIQFNVRLLSAAELLNLSGLAPTSLPEGVMVPLSNAATSSPSAQTPLTPSPLASSPLVPALAGAAHFSPTPFSFIPANSTGVLWTNGHTSIFSNPQSALLPTIRGYRGNLAYYTGEMFPGVGRWFTIRLNEGVPGAFRGDALFPLLPGQQSYLYVVRDGAQAAQFAQRLNATTYGDQYTYSPPRAGADPILGAVEPNEAQLYEILTRRGQAPMCTNNCITRPAPEIEAAIGMRPTSRSGVDVMTGTGPNGVVDPAHAGRGRLMTDAMASGPLAPGVQRLNITVTPGASASMFLVRGGGKVLLVYGIYHTEERIRESIGTPQLPTVLGEETGSWIGGLLGSALGGAAAGAILCAPTGPVTAVCVVGGFVGGFIVGAIGSAVGSEVGHTAVQGRPPEGGLLDTATAPLIEGAGELYNYLDFNIRQIYGAPF